MDNKVTIKDIARQAGISVSTVSRILNKTGRYSKETEKLVLKIVEETGYTANTAARSLRKAATNTIMLMIPDITNDFFSRLAYNIETYLQDQGYTTFICNTRGDSDKEAHYINEAIAKNVDGIIAIAYLEKLPKSYTTSPIPILLLDRVAGDFPHVINDEYKGTYDVAKLLIDRGSRYIIFLLPYVKENNYEYRSTGFIDCINAHPECRYELYPVKSGSESLKKAENQIYQLLMSDPSIDGVFCGSDRMALGALYGAQKAKRRVPEDLQIIGFDNAVYSQFSHPTLTTVGRNSQQLSVTACDKILAMIKNPDIKMASAKIPTHIIERESTR